MRRISRIALLCLPLLAACTYHRTVFGPLLQEDTPTGEVYQRFVIIRARSVFPVHDHEWDLNLAVPASAVREGTEVRVPSDHVEAMFSEWHHGRARVFARPTGAVRFLHVRRDAVQAEVDLRADVPGGWRLSRRVWFRYHPQAATDMPWLLPDTMQAR
ncbi:MAG TPA: hypothetical protein VF771_07700 [Longimicrobiaceae bacterium]